MNLIGYAYDADLHCEDCAERRFGAALYDEDKPPEDGEGNPVHPAFDTEEADSPMHCGDCHEFLGGGLTTDGLEYVYEALLDWTEHPERHRADVLMTWRCEFTTDLDFAIRFCRRFPERAGEMLYYGDPIDVIFEELGEQAREEREGADQADRG